MGVPLGLIWSRIISSYYACVKILSWAPLLLFYQKVSQLSCLRLCFGPLKMYRLFFCKNQQEIDPLSECTLKALESYANPSYFAAKSTESCHQEIWGPLVYLGRVVFFPHDKTNAWNALLNFRLKFRSVFQAKIVMIIYNVWLMWPSITKFH